MPTVIFTTYHTRQGIKHKMCVCGIVLFIDDIMKKKLRLFIYIATISSYNILYTFFVVWLHRHPLPRVLSCLHKIVCKGTPVISKGCVLF